MIREQLELTELISAEQLAAAMDELLMRIGVGQPNRSIVAEYIKPVPDYGMAIENRPFGRVARHPSGDGHYYTVESIIPNNGGSKDRLTFKDGRVFTRTDTWEQVGEDNQEEWTKETELSPQEVKELFDEVSSPALADRDRAIEAFYRKRYLSRGRVGRLIAHVLDTDRPRYF